MALGGRPVVELDDVRPVGPSPGLRALRPHAGADRHAVAPDRLRHRLRVAGVVRGKDPRPGLDDRGRHAEAGEDLAQLHTRRAAAEDEQAARQHPRERRLPVRPRVRRGQTLDRWHLRGRTRRDDDVVGFEQERFSAFRRGDLDPSLRDDPGVAAERPGAGILQRLDVARVVGRLGIGCAVDHVVAPRRCSLPRHVTAGRVHRGGVEQRLRRDAADVRAAATEPQAIDDGNGRIQLACLECGRLAGRTGPDDDELEPVHPRCHLPSA